jgi:hypothetical protein
MHACFWRALLIMRFVRRCFLDILERAAYIRSIGLEKMIEGVS